MEWSNPLFHSFIIQTRVSDRQGFSYKSCSQFFLKIDNRRILSYQQFKITKYENSGLIIVDYIVSGEGTYIIVI